MGRFSFHDEGEEERPKREPKDKSYRGLPPAGPRPAREADQVFDADGGHSPWPNGPPIDTQPLTFEQASERLQALSSGLLSVAEDELRELMTAWRADVTLAPTSFKAIQLVTELAGGKVKQAPPPEKKKDRGLEALAEVLVAKE